MNIYKRKDGRFESRIPNGKKPDGKRSFLYVLARTKEQCIDRVQAIIHQNRLQGYCSLTMTTLFGEWYHSILHRVKKSTSTTATTYAGHGLCRDIPATGMLGSPSKTV